jgi:hypothetical protein
MSEVRAAFAEYYKTERNRAEECLNDIVKILGEGADDPTMEIMDRLIKHYRRDEALK